MSYRFNLLWVLVLGIGTVARQCQGEYPSTLVPFKDLDQPGRNWTVKDCILARMALQVKIYPLPPNNTSITVDVPTNATSDGDCNPVDNSTQTLWLRWTEAQADNHTILLNRNITITFSKNLTTSMYVVEKLEMVYETRQYKKQVNNPSNGALVWTTTTEYMFMRTYTSASTLFTTPLNRSYQCSDAGTIDLETLLDDTSTPVSWSGILLKNATVSATKVRLDAFRSRSALYNQFQIPLDCTFHSNDEVVLPNYVFNPNYVVLIIVSCVLVSLVVLVPIVFLVGKRRSRPHLVQEDTKTFKGKDIFHDKSVIGVYLVLQEDQY